MQENPIASEQGCPTGCAKKNRTNAIKEVKGQTPRQARSEENLNGGTTPKQARQSPMDIQGKEQDTTSTRKQVRLVQGKIPKG